MPNRFVTKMMCGANLSDADRAALNDICRRPRRIDARQHIICEGDKPDDVHLVLEGAACRSKRLLNGQRQIMALLLPGDFCDLHVAILGEMDHDIVTLTPCTVVDIPKAVVETLTQVSRGVLQALWWATLVDEAILREWLVNMGRRSAEERMSHLFCELLARLTAVGLVEDNAYDLPLTQEELSDILGLSAVHVSRVLQYLRGAGLVEWRRGRMKIVDAERLEVISGFNSNYLHLRGNASAPINVS